MIFRPLQLIFTLFILSIFFLPAILPRSVNSGFVSPLNLSSLSQNLVSSSSAVPIASHYTVDQITTHLQNARLKVGLPVLKTDIAVCQTGEGLIFSASPSAQLTAHDLTPFCPQCNQKAFLTIEGNYFIPGQVPWMADDQVTKLISGAFTHLCVYQTESHALLLLGKISTPSTASKADEFKSSSVSPLNFSESQLWQALVDYRHAHTKPDLQTVDSLCQYARERVAEHIKLFAEKPKNEYANQDKYPLDAHAGFQRDGTSGYLFEKTGFNVVAENLAYWPAATSPNQVIEWGWDTSTEGHREAQLSDEYSHACLSGGEGFYVAIFARN